MQSKTIKNKQLIQYPRPLAQLGETKTFRLFEIQKTDARGETKWPSEGINLKQILTPVTEQTNDKTKDLYSNF